MGTVPNVKVYTLLRTYKMPLSCVEKETLKAATPLFILDGDVKEMLTGLYGTIFDSTDRHIILLEVSPGERMMSLLELYETKADSLVPLITVLEQYTLQPHIAAELKKTRPTFRRQMTFQDSLTAAPSSGIQTPLVKFYVSNFNNFKPIAQMGTSFPMESCWTHLSMEYDSRHFEDYTTCLTEGLSHGQPVIITGEPGFGKSTLMKRIAFDWAKGNFNHYDLVLGGRLREVTGEVDTIIDITENWLKRKLAKGSWSETNKLVE